MVPPISRQGWVVLPATAPGGSFSFPLPSIPFSAGWLCILRPEAAESLSWGGSEREAGALLSALDEASRTDLEALGRQQSVARGTTLIAEGQRSDRLIAITSGRVKLTCLTDDGREVVLAVAGPGELLGELSFFDGGPHSSTAVALEKVDALVFSAGDFRRYLESHPTAAILLLRMLSARLREAVRVQVEFAAFDSVGRVARRLLEMAERFGQAEPDGIRVTLQLSQEELAGWVGASREAVNKALGMLRGLGWIETHRRGVTILDLAALKKRAT